MQDLRLIGVHEGGDHLLLADADGVRYRLPLDEPLRAAARRDRPRLGQLQIEIEGGLRPRDVQALIRSGLSAAEVADRSGWSVEKVHRFEGPVLAEREFMAIRAQRTVLSHDGRVTLGDRAASRLRGRGVDADAVTWDSLREESGQWLVSATFAAGGRERTASWRFDPQTQQLRAQNDDARWLGEDEKVGPIPAPHVARAGGSSDEVFDVTRPASSARSARPTVSSAGPSGRQQDDELTESLRAHTTQCGRRGRRRASGPASAPGAHLSPVDALPLEPLLGDLDELGPPPARPRVPDAASQATKGDPAPQVESPAQDQTPPSDAPAPSPTSETADAGQPEVAPDAQPEAVPDAQPEALPEAQPEAGSDAQPEALPKTGSDAQPEAGSGVEPEGGPDTDSETAPAAGPAEPDPSSDPAPDDTATDDKPKTDDRSEPAAKPAETGRRGRARVPSWDDVVFGTRSRPSSPDR